MTQTVDTLLHATTFGYDDLGRRLTVTDAESNVTTYEYDALGNQTAMIDAETIRTTYEYDDLNRLVQVIENDVPGSNPTHETDVVTEYSYDALGNRVHITNALGITNTHTTYDVLNRPWIVEDALGNQTVTLYNALGYRVVMTDGNEAITTYGYDGLNRLETVNYLADGIVVTYEYDALGNRKVMTDDLGTTSYDYDALYRLTEVIDPFNATVEYGYDKVGNRTSLTYPDSRMVTYTYDFDNRLETVLDWDTGTTTYEYDLAGRLITTTLPSGVVSVNSYDDANRLTNLSHTSSNDVLIANFAYELDKVGNRITATETIRQPGALAWVTAFLEENGQLVLEAESGTATAGTSHTWNSQTVQGDYAGTAYLRALPDIGQQYDATATADSPGLNFTVQIDNPGSYTVWARGMAPDAAGDSLHVGVNDGTPTTAANLTGFTPNEWSWSRLTMSNTNATVDLSSSGTYTLNVWMREDGLRLDKLMLVTDTATIPTGQGPLESGTTTALPPLGDQFITYEYDPLYRLTEAIYTGTFNGTYQYEYDAVGNRETYTTTIATTEVTSYQYDDANRLTQSTIQGGDTTTYEWDDASRLITTTVASTISRVYGYSQDGDMLSALVDGETTTFLYDGNGNRLQMTVGSEVTIYTLDYAKGFRTLMEQGGAFAETKHYLYGLACVGELVDADEPATKEWRYYQRDGNSLVRQTTNEEEAITLAWAFSPEGAVVLGEEGPVTNLDCGNNATYDWSTGLIFKNGRYFDPNTGIWLTLGGVFIWNASWRRRFSRYGKRRRKMLLFLLYVFAAFSLIGCGSNPTPTVTSTPCPTPFDTPIPGLPSSTPMSPISTIGSPSTLTPVPTSIQFPTNIPTSSPTPYPTLPINPTPSGAQLAEYTYNWLNDRNNAQVMNAWWFNDNVSPGLLDQKEVIALNMQYEGISALGQNIPGFLEAFARQYHGNCGGCSMDDPRFWNFIGHNESWNAASTNNQVLNDYLSTDLHSMPVYNLAEEVLNPSNSTWRRGKDDNRPWSWFNVLSNHPTWLIERMNNWPDINFWYRRPDKLFAVLTPNQQKALCGQDQNGHEVSCAALTSSSPEPSN